MPQVPRRDPASLPDPGNLPGVQVTGGGATEETFGGGASAKASQKAIEGLGDAGFKYALEAREHADRAIAQSYDTAAVRKKNEIMTTLAKNYRGAKAAEGSEWANQEWSDWIDSEKESMPNKRIIGFVGKRYGTYSGQLNTAVANFEFRESDQFRSDQNEAQREAHKEDGSKGYAQPGQREESLGMIMEADIDEAERLGIPLDSDIFKNTIREDTADLDKRTIQKILDDGDVDRAERYLKVHGSNLTTEDRRTYSKYIKQERAYKESQMAAEQKAMWEDTDRQTTLDSIDGNANLSEVQRKFDAGEMSDSDYRYWENKLTSDDYLAWRKRMLVERSEGEDRSFGQSKLTDTKTFNDIRNHQLKQTRSKTEIQKMIRDNVEKFRPEDGRFLMDQNDKVEATPDDLMVSGYMDSLRDFGQKYFEPTFVAGIQRPGVTGVPAFKFDNFTEEDAKMLTNDMVKHFQDRVVNENAQGKEKIFEIYKEVKNQAVKEYDPGLAGYDVLPDIVTGISGLVKWVLNAGEKPKTDLALVRTAKGGLTGSKKTEEK